MRSIRNSCGAVSLAPKASGLAASTVSPTFLLSSTRLVTFGVMRVEIHVFLAMTGSNKQLFWGLTYIAVLCMMVA
jgi:hypothetical protein